MKYYRCGKCKRGVCPRRKSNKRIGDIMELADTTTHEDGSKERVIWARTNERTQEILEARLI